MPNILALDPAFRHFGWVVFSVTASGETPIDAGCIVTKKAAKKKGIYAADDNHQCAQAIARKLFYLVDYYNPALICAEAPGGSQSSKAAQLLGASAGILSTVVAYHETIPFIQVDKMSIKKALTGGNKASKDEIEAVVVEKYPALRELCTSVNPPSLHEHVYDAGGVLIACGDASEVQMVRQIARHQED
jgi:Holliday junction resolvasome RuvABC endonuclease subunit